MIRRVFLVTSYQIKVFEWDRKHLSASYEFKNYEKGGLLEFESYLQASQAISSQILVELLEEDFQRDKIPHLFGSDRNALIQRQISRHYRDNKHTHAHIIGRDNQGRRDDEVLLTSISNSEPLDKWMNIFEKYDVPIMGIWSLPLISEEIIKKISKKNENVLLVSRQMRSTLRESCFRNERLLLSRQVKIDPALRSKNTAAGYLSAGVEQIHKYLSNQRIIPFGSMLDVYCLIPEDLIDEAQNQYTDSDTLAYHFVTIESLLKDFGVSSAHGHQADVFFSYLCSRKSPKTDHYHPGGEKNAYYAHLIEKFIFYTSTIGSLVLIAVAAFLVVNGIEIQSDTKATESSRARLVTTYNKNFSRLEKQIESAESIRDTIAFSHRLRSESDISPEKFLKPLGNILGKPQYAMIHINALEWEKYHGNSLETLRLNIWKKTTPNLTEYSEYPYDEAELDDKIPVITLSGTMKRGAFKYRETVSIMDNFAKELAAIPEVDKVLATKTPVDIRADSKFRDQSGTDSDLHVANDDSNIFEIILLLKPLEETNIEIADNA